MHGYLPTAGCAAAPPADPLQLLHALGARERILLRHRPGRVEVHPFDDALEPALLRGLVVPVDEGSAPVAVLVAAGHAWPLPSRTFDDDGQTFLEVL